MKRFLDVRECAQYLNISTHQVYKMAEMKQIPTTRICRKLLFDIKKLERFIEENSVEVQDLNEKVQELLK